MCVSASTIVLDSCKGARPLRHLRQTWQLSYCTGLAGSGVSREGVIS